MMDRCVIASHGFSIFRFGKHHYHPIDLVLARKYEACEFGTIILRAGADLEHPAVKFLMERLHDGSEPEEEEKRPTGY